MRAVMNETNKSETKEVKINTEKSESSKTNNKINSKEAHGTAPDASKKNETSKSASQISISHFSSVSTPEYRSGWNKIFGKSNNIDESIKPRSDYERRKDFVVKHWNKYQQTKNTEHLAIICREMPFFDNPEVGREIARLLSK